MLIIVINETIIIGEMAHYTISRNPRRENLILSGNPPPNTLPFKLTIISIVNSSSIQPHSTQFWN